MNLDDLKTVWKDYDRKLASTQAIQEKIITSILTTRSRSNWTRARRHYLWGCFSASIWLLFGCAVLFGNPFDFRYVHQYIPIGAMSVCFLIFLILFAVNYRDLNNIEIRPDSLDVSLKKIIHHYELPRKFLKGVRCAYLVSAFCFPFSFLYPKIERKGILLALADTAIPIAIGLILIFVAAKLGAFKEKHKERFEADLNELNELKSISAELSS